MVQNRPNGSKWTELDEIEPNRLEWTKMNRIDQIRPNIDQLDQSEPNMIFKKGEKQGVIEAISMQQYIC